MKRCPYCGRTFRTLWSVRSHLGGSKNGLECHRALMQDIRSVIVEYRRLRNSIRYRRVGGVRYYSLDGVSWFPRIAELAKWVEEGGYLAVVR
jgi:hypothetical protein